MTNTTTKPTESFADLFAESLAKQEMKQGEVIPAEVVRVDYNYVVVNAGLKSESFIPIEEFKNDRGEVDVKVGDFVSVAIESLENGYGDTVLSRDKAKRLAAWMNLEKALETGELVTGTVTGKVKGGLTVMTNGIRAFLPGSLVDTRPVKDTTPYEGKTMEFKVIKLDRKRNNVVLSRRVLLEEGRKNERAEILEKLSKGMRLKGNVSSIVDFGAFVDLGGIDGLVHISELSWNHVNHPSEVVKVGDEVEVEVLDVDLQRERISLGLKQTTEDPWIKLVEVYPVDTIVDGRVTKIVPFGAFIELGDNVEGLVHISEMAMKHIDSPNQVVSVGDEVKVKVMDVNTDRRRISLSMKAAAEDLGIEIDVDEPEPKEEAEDAE